MTTLYDFINHIRELFAGLLTFFEWKFLSSIAIPLIAFLFGLENILVLQSLLVLVCIDFITGIIAARVSGQKITSRMSVKSAFKIAVYGLLASSGHLTEVITPGNTFIEEAVMTFLAITELISIIENAGRMGYAVPKKLLNQLQKLRDEDTTVKEVATTHTIKDDNTGIVETHHVVEKVEEKHTVEKPNPPVQEQKG